MTCNSSLLMIFLKAEKKPSESFANGQGQGSLMVSASDS